MKSRMQRRAFLRRAVGGGVGLLILKNSQSVCTAQANEKLNIALIGVGGRGTWFVDTIPQMENVVAICDVNDQRAAESYQKLPNTPRFYDFRQMLQEMQDTIDAVIIAAPDHIHAPASLHAMRLGKHVYCEKPLTRDVRESRAMRETAREKQVATQLGNQGTAHPAFRRSVELIEDGVLGEIRDVYVVKDGGGTGPRPRPTTEEPVPEWLKWDLWLGPCQFRPYNRQWTQWHSWRDFGTSQLGNWATHTANLAFKALNIDWLWFAHRAVGPPRMLRIEAKVSEIDHDSFPKWEMIRWDIPARGDLPPVTFHYYNGSAAPGAREEVEQLLGRKLDWGDAGARKWEDHAALLIVGSEARLYGNGHNTVCQLIRDGTVEPITEPPQRLPRSPGHEREWLNACRGGDPAMSNFDYGGPLVEFLMLGNLSTQFDHAIEFDPIACQVTNDEEADKALLRAPYREGWTL
jgi:hypothetical protein